MGLFLQRQESSIAVLPPSNFKTGEFRRTSERSRSAQRDVHEQENLPVILNKENHALGREIASVSPSSLEAFLPYATMDQMCKLRFALDSQLGSAGHVEGALQRAGVRHGAMARLPR